MNSSLVELVNICKNFDDVTVLKDINLNIKPHESLSICGISGSGKTTLVNLIGLLQQPTSGKILWYGNDVMTLSAKQISQTRAKTFGYVFQQCHLIPELNVIENILFPKRMIGRVSQEDIAFAHKLLQYVGLKGFEQRNITTLSGGESQRIATIRAMINHPSIVIADEPTGSLDINSATTVIDMLIDLCTQYGSTLLLITHNTKFAEKTDSIYHIENFQLRKVK